MENHSVVFRDYSSKDLAPCVGLALEAWPFPPGMGVGAKTEDMISNWIGSTVSSSTYAEVAEDEHGIVGMLFGEIRGGTRLGKQREQGAYGIGLSTMLRGLLGEYGNIRLAFGIIMSFFITELKLMVNRTRSDAEITMLIVGESHRGKGLGKELVDRFIEAAKKQGARSVSLYTDDQTSNWRFYEAYGFKQVAKFYDNGSSRYSGKHANALIYRLDFG